MESKYHCSPDDKMATLIAENYSLIQVMSRFGIKVGFGDLTVSEVCENSGVDCSTFLTVVNFTIDGYSHADQTHNISLGSLLHYLRQSHIYFLDFFLPAIRRKLLDGIPFGDDSIALLILKFFDEYALQVRKHMDYEDKTVFGYVDALLAGNPGSDYSIETYSDHHAEVASSLRELKSIILKYAPAGADVNILNDALYDIFRCEQELATHCLIEDELLSPAVRRLEKEISTEKGK